MVIPKRQTVLLSPEKSPIQFTIENSIHPRGAAFAAPFF